jgi:ABC-type transporter Mla MlaB component
MAAPAPTTIVCDVGALGTPDAGTIDLLAHMQLTALRFGCRIRLRDVSPALRQLIAFSGLDEVLRVETGWESEEREQRVGVEEERELPDASV